MSYRLAIIQDGHLGARHIPKKFPSSEKNTVFMFGGRDWHRSGANTTMDQHRMAANMMYLPGAGERPREWSLVKRDVYNRFPVRLKDMLVQSVEFPDTLSSTTEAPEIWMLRSGDGKREGFTPTVQNK